MTRKKRRRVCDNDAHLVRGNGGEHTQGDLVSLFFHSPRSLSLSLSLSVSLSRPHTHTHTHIHTHTHTHFSAFTLSLFTLSLVPSLFSHSSRALSFSLFSLFSLALSFAFTPASRILPPFALHPLPLETDRSALSFSSVHTLWSLLACRTLFFLVAFLFLSPRPPSTNTHTNTHTRTHAHTNKPAAHIIHTDHTKHTHTHTQNTQHKPRSRQIRLKPHYGHFCPASFLRSQATSPLAPASPTHPTHTHTAP